jgi:hypothetical protein
MLTPRRRKWCEGDEAVFPLRRRRCAHISSDDYPPLALRRRIVSADPIVPSARYRQLSPIFAETGKASGTRTRSV